MTTDGLIRVLVQERQPREKLGITLENEASYLQVKHKQCL